MSYSSVLMMYFPPPDCPQANISWASTGHSCPATSVTMRQQNGLFPVVGAQSWLFPDICTQSLLFSFVCHNKQRYTYNVPYLGNNGEIIPLGVVVSTAARQCLFCVFTKSEVEIPTQILQAKSHVSSKQHWGWYGSLEFHSYTQLSWTGS